MPATVRVIDLKSQQDGSNATKEALLAIVRPFREHFFDRLAQFTQEAVAAGIEGVRPWDAVPAGQAQVFETTLNHLPLTFAATDRVASFADPVAPGRLGPITARICIYANPDSRALYEVQIVALPEQKVTALLYEQWKDQKKLMAPGLDAKIPENGIEAANLLLDRVYSIQSFWKETLTLEQFLTSSASDRRPLGF